jgi:hypothetical protein
VLVKIIGFRFRIKPRTSHKEGMLTFQPWALFHCLVFEQKTTMEACNDGVIGKQCSLRGPCDPTRCNNRTAGRGVFCAVCAEVL